MKFTVQDVDYPHEGSKFIDFIRHLKRVGVLAYDYDLKTGIFTFFGDDHHRVSLPSNGLSFEGAEDSSPEAVQAATEKVARGEMSFKEFCKAAAEAGVHYWETNLDHLEIEYRNHKSKAIFRQLIPQFADEAR